MPSDMKELFRATVKESKSEMEAVKRNVELEKLLQELDLTKEQYNEFLAKRDEYKPSLYDVNCIFDDEIVGELKTRMSAFCSFILSEIPTYISGPSSGGKTMIMQACADCLFPGDALIIESGSDKVIYDQQRDIVKSKYIIIREVNKLNPMMEELLKAWGESKPAIYRRSGGICGKMQEFELPSRPFIVSRADESATTNLIGAELMSRMVEITVNGSQDQTKKVISRQAAGIENPFDVKQIDYVERALLRYHISNIPKFDICVNPAGTKLTEFVPTIFTTSRRDFLKYLKNCEGITRFFYKDRIQTTIQGKSTIFSSPADAFLNQIIFGDVLIQSSLRCSDLEKLMMQVIKKNGSLSKAQVQSQLRKWSLNVTAKTINTHLEHLTDLGYLDASKEGTSLFYSVSDFYKEFEVVPNFKEVVSSCIDVMQSVKYYQPYADEYVERFCKGSGLEIVDPYTGNIINILEYDFGSPIDIDDDTRIKKIKDDPVEKVTSKSSNLNDWW